MSKQANMGNWGRTSKQNRILAAVLGFVATTGVCGAFGTFATFENRALFGDETSTAAGGRQIVVEPKGGELAKPSARKAFLVAADDYGDAANPLPCTKNDVKALKTRLETLGFTTVVLETGDNRQTEPTKAIIERRFKRFVESLRPGDFALVYLSGHGLKPTDSDESFFAPVDVDVEDLFATSVSIDRMLADLKASDATFRWVIVDACRDDPTNPEDDEAAVFKGASKSIGARALGDVKKVPDSVALLQSCQPGKRSYEGGGRGAERIENGFFTLSLLEALDDENSRADANGDGVLTFSETFEYVSRRTDELARGSYGVSQIPNLSGSITNFALLDELLIDGLTKSKWNEANGLYQEACVFRSQKKWREALAKIKKAREINKARKEYETAEAEIQAQVDATVASETRTEADKLAADAWTAFDLGGETNVEEAIRLMKKSLELVDLTANRRVLKTFEEKLEALRNSVPTPPQPTSGHASALPAADAGGRPTSTGDSSNETPPSPRRAPRWNGVEYVAVDESELGPSPPSPSNGSALNPTHRYARNNGRPSAPTGGSTSGSRLVGMGPSGVRTSPTGTSSSSTRSQRPTSQTQTSSASGDSSSGGTSTGTSASGAWSGTYAAGTAKSLTIKGETYTFHYCPAGSFTMGSPESEEGRGSDETQHRVELTNGFWMLETEVTQAMWKSLMGSNPSYFSSSGGGSSKVSGMDTSNFPVEKVSWTDCQDFIAKLNTGGYAPSGFEFRLPTEAEWEYACRANTPGPYAGSRLDTLGWYENNSDGRTHEVGTKAPNGWGLYPNGWGLYDMHGNVWEWCEDKYAAYDTSNNARDPINVTIGSNRVVRGGSWICSAEYCRSADRQYGGPTYRRDNSGFRLALVRSSSRK